MGMRTWARKPKTKETLLLSPGLFDSIVAECVPVGMFCVFLFSFYSFDDGTLVWLFGL